MACLAKKSAGWITSPLAVGIALIAAAFLAAFCVDGGGTGSGRGANGVLRLAKVAEHPLAADGCGGIAYSGKGGRFYVLQDHADDGYARVRPLELEIDPGTGDILKQTLGEAFKPGKLRDAEGLDCDPCAGTLWISDECAPPSISEFRLDGTATGRKVPVPAVQRSKLRGNLSLESLAMSSDGLTMWTANEQALKCDGETSKGNTNVSTVVRLTRFTRAAPQADWKAAGEWAYVCDACAGTAYPDSQSGLSGLCALPDGSLLALEREVSIETRGRCRIYRVTAGALAAATDVSGFPALTNAAFSAVAKGDCLLDFNGPQPESVFGPYGIIVYEGIALGPRLNDGSHSVYLVSDGGASISRKMGPFMVTATAASRICALRLTGLAGDRK